MSAISQVRLNLSIQDARLTLFWLTQLVHYQKRRFGYHIESDYGIVD